MGIDGRGTGMSVADYYELNGVPLTASRNDRSAAGIAIHEWLNTVIDEDPKLQILRHGAPTLIRTLPEMRQDKRDPSNAANGNDHWVISLGYFCQEWEAVIGGVNSLPLWMRKPSTRRARFVPSAAQTGGVRQNDVSVKTWQARIDTCRQQREKLAKTWKTSRRLSQG